MHECQKNSLKEETSITDHIVSFSGANIFMIALWLLASYYNDLLQKEVVTTALCLRMLNICKLAHTLGTGF